MRRAFYALVLLVYMATPYVALGFHADKCECMAGSVQCGTGGALCHCCMGEMRMIECDNSEQFRSCRGSTSLQATSQPLAIAEPLTLYAFCYITTGFLTESESTPSDEFKFQPFKPPRAG